MHCRVDPHPLAEALCSWHIILGSFPPSLHTMHHLFMVLTGTNYRDSHGADVFKRELIGTLRLIEFVTITGDDN